MPNNGRPKCPNPDRLHELIQAHLDEIETYHTPDNKLEAQWKKEAEDTVAALEWLENFLSDRALYHRKQQLKNKHIKRLAVEHGLIEDATRHADEELFNEVANSAPDKEDVEP